MKPERHLWLSFFRGLNVFGRGTIPMFDLERRCRTAFVDSGLSTGKMVIVTVYRD